MGSWMSHRHLPTGGCDTWAHVGNSDFRHQRHKHCPHALARPWAWPVRTAPPGCGAGLKAQPTGDGTWTVQPPRLLLKSLVPPRFVLPSFVPPSFVLPSRAPPDFVLRSFEPPSFTLPNVVLPKFVLPRFVPSTNKRALALREAKPQTVRQPMEDDCASRGPCRPPPQLQPGETRSQSEGVGWNPWGACVGWHPWGSSLRLQPPGMAPDGPSSRHQMVTSDPEDGAALTSKLSAASSHSEQGSGSRAETGERQAAETAVSSLRTLAPGLESHATCSHVQPHVPLGCNTERDGSKPQAPDAVASGPRAEGLGAASGPPAEGFDAASGSKSETLDAASGPTVGGLGAASGPVGGNLETASGPTAEGLDAAPGPNSEGPGTASGPMPEGPGPECGESWEIWDQMSPPVRQLLSSLEGSWRELLQYDHLTRCTLPQVSSLLPRGSLSCAAF